jgi:hypothetical protein
MTSAGTVTVDVQGRDVNLVALLTRLEAKMRETDQQGIRLSQTTGGTLAGAQLRAANAAISEAQAMTRAAVAVGDNARAHEILITALGNSTGASDRAVAGLTAQLGRLQSGTSLATQFGDSLKLFLLGIIGPAALATGAIAAVKGAIDFSEQSFRLKAALDTTNAAIAIQLRGVRDSAQVFAEANAFADRYRLTQVETAAAIQASIPILRTSNASLTEIEGTLLRLQAKKPEKRIADAARALDELRAGQIISIVDQFNVSREAANKMKNEIAGGADAVQVLSRYLDDAGISMAALDNQTKGATGKMNQLAQEAERHQLSFGQDAAGPGDPERATAGNAVAHRRCSRRVGVARRSQPAIRLGPHPDWRLRGGAGRTHTRPHRREPERCGCGSQHAQMQAHLTSEHQVGASAAAQQAAAIAFLRSEHLAGGEAAGNEARMLQQSADASLLDARVARSLA